MIYNLWVYYVFLCLREYVLARERFFDETVGVDLVGPVLDGFLAWYACKEVIFVIN